MPQSYPLSDLTKLERYPDGMSLPTPKGRDFTQGELLVLCIKRIRTEKILKNGHDFIVTSSKDGDDCEADKHIVDSDIVISQPFFPTNQPSKELKKQKT